MRRPLCVVAVAAIVGVLSPMPAAVAAPGPVPVQLLAINDLHGRIAPTTGNESRLVTGPRAVGVRGGGVSAGTDDVVTRVGRATYVASTVEERQQDFRGQAGGSAASFLV